VIIVCVAVYYNLCGGFVRCISP